MAHKKEVDAARRFGGDKVLNKGKRIPVPGFDQKLGELTKLDIGQVSAAGAVWAMAKLGDMPKVDTPLIGQSGKIIVLTVETFEGIMRDAYVAGAYGRTIK